MSNLLTWGDWTLDQRATQIGGHVAIAYATGGVVDAVDDSQSGYLVPSGHSEAFANAVLTLLGQPLPVDALAQHANRFTWLAFGQKLMRELTASSA